MKALHFAHFAGLPSFGGNTEPDIVKFNWCLLKKASSANYVPFYVPFCGNI
jgi:hypothetical protein